MKIGKVDIELFAVQGHNDPYATERMIEIPIGRWFLNKYGPKILEIGAVLPYYQEVTHDVLDPYDKWPKCIRKGVNDVSYEGLNVLSISTIEHVGHDEYNQVKNPKDAQEAIDRIRKADTYLVTWAAAYHSELDNYIINSSDVIKIKRTAFQKWEVVNDLSGVKFMSPWHCGNGLYVVTNCKDLYA